MGNNLKKTPLYEEHLRKNAKMVEFAGWNMPLQYKSIIEEVKIVRNDVGIFDVSHMGEIFIKGPETAEFVNYIITNDFKNLKYGEAVYSPMCNEKGGIIDDLIAYKIDSETAILVVNAGNIEKDYNWILEKSKKFNVTVENLSNDYALIAVQGPKAEKKLQEIVDIHLDKLPYYGIKTCRVRGVEVLISRTGYTGEDGFELMIRPEVAVTVWRTLIEYGMEPCGLGARDILRLEASYLLYGNDMDESTNPLEVGLKWTVKFKKGEFVGKEALTAIKSEGIKRKLIGFVVDGKGIARHGDKVVGDDEEIGLVTSGAYSPTLEKSIGLALIRKNYAEAGSEIIIISRNKKLKAQIVKLPFYRGSVKNKK